MRSLRTALVVAAAISLFAMPATAGAWTRIAQLGALPINGDAKHRIAGFVNWEMPSDWTSSITEYDIPGVRFWPSNPAPGCRALSVFTFQGAYTKGSITVRARQSTPVRSGGVVLGSGVRSGGVWRLVQNITFADGMPVIPGAHYVDGVGLVKVGANRYLELAFRSYSDGTCTGSEIRNSNVVTGATAFLRDATSGLRVIGKWPAGVNR